MLAFRRRIECIVSMINLGIEEWKRRQAKFTQHHIHDSRPFRYQIRPFLRDRSSGRRLCLIHYIHFRSYTSKLVLCLSSMAPVEAIVDLLGGVCGLEVSGQSRVSV